MLVEERKFFQQHFEFYLVHCLEDVFVVRTEKKELAASATSPASGLTSLIQLLAVLYQIETVLYSWDLVLLEQSLENLRRVDGASAVKQGESRQNHGFLLKVSEPFRVYSKGDFLFVIDILYGFQRLLSGKVLSIGDAYSNKHCHHLSHLDEIDLVFIFQNIQDLFLEAKVDELKDLSVGDPSGIKLWFMVDALTRKTAS